MKRTSRTIAPLRNARRVNRCPHRWAASFTGVALILLFAAPASASADLLEEATRTVGSLPSSATEAVPTPPTPPPPPPPVHVSVPPPPTLESSPPPVEPTGVASASSGLAGGLAGGASEVADGAKGAGSVGSDVVQASPGQLAAASPGEPGATSHTAEHRAVKPRQPARPRTLLAYVWPAIALGPFGRLLSTLEPRLRAAAALLLHGAPRLPSGLSAGALGRGGAPERSASSAPPQADSPFVSLPGAAAISLLVLLLASAAMVALLVFAVRFEMGFAHHRRPHS
jgi:hypothetical protein